MSDVRILRERQESLASAVRRFGAAGGHDSEVALVQTKGEDGYPTAAPAFYACTPLKIDGIEVEGADVTFTADPSRVVMAFNLGSRVPPIGTRLIIHSSGGRWAFRYDG